MHRRIWLIIVSVWSFSFPSHGVDFGYRFKDGFCQKNGKAGFNPDHRGECGVITGLIIENRNVKAMKIRGANINSSYLRYSKFYDSNLSFTIARRTEFTGSLFSNVRATKVDLRGSYLQSSHWVDSDLRYWVAMGVRAEKAVFKNCNLQKANFWGSNLQEVDFSGSDLRGADLRSTFLLFTKFTGAKFNQKTLLPFSQEEAVARGMIKID